MVIKEKLYMLAKDHDSDEALRLAELVEDDADINEIIEAKDEFLNLLALRCEISREDYEDLVQLELDTVYSGDEDDVPEAE